MNTRRKLAPLCIMVLLVTSLVPASVQADGAPSVQITTHWIGDGTTDAAHAYLLTFSDNGTYGFDVDMVHQRNGSSLSTVHTMAWDSMDGVRTALLNFNTSLLWGDTVELTITITDHNTRRQVVLEGDDYLEWANSQRADASLELILRARGVCCASTVAHHRIDQPPRGKPTETAAEGAGTQMAACDHFDPQADREGSAGAAPPPAAPGDGLAPPPAPA